MRLGAVTGLRSRHTSVPALYGFKVPCLFKACALLSPPAWITILTATCSGFLCCHVMSGAAGFTSLWAISAHDITA